MFCDATYYKLHAAFERLLMLNALFTDFLENAFKILYARQHGSLKRTKKSAKKDYAFSPQQKTFANLNFRDHFLHKKKWKSQ